MNLAGEEIVKRLSRNVMIRQTCDLLHDPRGWHGDKRYVDGSLHSYILMQT